MATGGVEAAASIDCGTEDSGLDTTGVDAGAAFDVTASRFCTLVSFWL